MQAGLRWHLIGLLSTITSLHSGPATGQWRRNERTFFLRGTESKMQAGLRWHLIGLLSTITSLHSGPATGQRRRNVRTFLKENWTKDASWPEAALDQLALHHHQSPLRPGHRMKKKWQDIFKRELNQRHKQAWEHKKHACFFICQLHAVVLSIYVKYTPKYFFSPTLYQRRAEKRLAGVKNIGSFCHTCQQPCLHNSPTILFKWQDNKLSQKLLCVNCFILFLSTGPLKLFWLGSPLNLDSHSPCFGFMIHSFKHS